MFCSKRAGVLGSTELEALGSEHIKKGVKIVFLHLGTRYPHNGCRPIKVRRKKFRTKSKLFR